MLSFMRNCFYLQNGNKYWEREHSSQQFEFLSNQYLEYLLVTAREAHPLNSEREPRPQRLQ